MRSHMSHIAKTVETVWVNPNSTLLPHPKAFDLYRNHLATLGKILITQF